MTGSLELKNSYDAMYDAALPSVITGTVTIDPLLDDQTDQRRGLLLFRFFDPIGKFLKIFSAFLLD